MGKFCWGIGAAFGCVAVLGLLAGRPPGSTVHGQERDRSSSRSKRGDTPNPKLLDMQAERTVEEFTQELARLAQQYEEAGEYQKSKRLLESILKLRPELSGVQEKIQELDEAMLSTNEFDFELEVGQGWGPPRARVFEDKPFRLQADGTYRFVVNQTVGPEGFSTKKPEQGDMAAGVPCGTLMGLIVGQDKEGKPKAGKPFPVGAERDVTPKQDGLLFLKLNLPPGHQCKGRIQVQLSGAVLARSNR